MKTLVILGRQSILVTLAASYMANPDSKLFGYSRLQAKWLPQIARFMATPYYKLYGYPGLQAIWVPQLASCTTTSDCKLHGYPRLQAISESKLYGYLILQEKVEICTLLEGLPSKR